jgi:hypothetical protein
MKRFDRELRTKVQLVECEIPRDLENSIMERLDKEQPEVIRLTKNSNRVSNWVYGSLAAAAVLVLVVMLFVFRYVHRPVEKVEAEEVGVQSAYVEGKPATTMVFKQPGTDLTMVWIEKIDSNINNVKK